MTTRLKNNLIMSAVVTAVLGLAALGVWGPDYSPASTYKSDPDAGPQKTDRQLMIEEERDSVFVYCGRNPDICSAL